VIRAWTRTADLWETQTDLLRQVKERFDGAGISIPFPQSEIRLIRQPQDNG